MKITELNSEGLKLVTDIDFAVDRNEIYRLSGGKGENNKFNTKLEKIINEKIFQAHSLINPKAVYVIKEVKEAGKEDIFFSDKSQIKLKLFNQSISHIKKTAIALCTLGKAVDEKIVELNNEGSSTEAFILDIIGSVAVEEIANKINFLICQQTEKYGLQASHRFSPGYGNFNLIEQENIFKIINAEKIGVSLTKSYMMIPKKSISFCIYLGKMKKDSRNQCTICGLKDCNFRKE